MNSKHCVAHLLIIPAISTISPVINISPTPAPNNIQLSAQASAPSLIPTFVAGFLGALLTFLGFLLQTYISEIKKKRRAASKLDYLYLIATHNYNENRLAACKENVIEIGEIVTDNWGFIDPKSFPSFRALLSIIDMCIERDKNDLNMCELLDAFYQNLNTYHHIKLTAHIETISEEIEA